MHAGVQAGEPQRRLLAHTHSSNEPVTAAVRSGGWKQQRPQQLHGIGLWWDVSRQARPGGNRLPAAACSSCTARAVYDVSLPGRQLQCCCWVSTAANGCSGLQQLCGSSVGWVEKAAVVGNEQARAVLLHQHSCAASRGCSSSSSHLGLPRFAQHSTAQQRMGQPAAALRFRAAKQARAKGRD